MNIAINGFGRIGRSVFRILNSKEEVNLVAINDIFDKDALTYLLKYDTVMGRFPEEVKLDGDILKTESQSVKLLAERDPASLPWDELGVDIVIESTGISEPLPVAATFEFRDEQGVSLADVARLDTMVTVVDAVNLLNDFSSHDFLKDREESLEQDDDRTLVHLLTEQIEFADVVILNKTYDAGTSKTDAARKIIRSLNADTEIIETNYSRVQIDKIMDTGLFDFEKAHEHPLWAKELYGFADHIPETEEYGVNSYVYRARLPFIPEKILKVLNGNLPGVIRAKGHFWISTRPEWVAEFSLAGSLSSIKPLGIWWATVPEERLPKDENTKAYIKTHWSEPWGDRRQELVFIGSGIDWQQIKTKLDECLVPKAQASSVEDLPNFKDPFPIWRREEDAA